MNQKNQNKIEQYIINTISLIINRRIVSNNKSCVF